MNLLSRTLEFGPTANGSFRFSAGAQGGNRNCQVKTRMGRWAFAARDGYLISALQTGHGLTNFGSLQCQNHPGCFSQVEVAGGDGDHSHLKFKQ
jgi:hypothetical protein